MNVVKMVVLGLLLMISGKTFSCPNPYIVKEGDNLWSLAEVKLNDPLKWIGLAAENSILMDTTRYSTDKRGRMIILIRPGEKLCGLEEAGIDLNSFGTQGYWAAGYSENYQSPQASSEKSNPNVSEPWWELAQVVGFIIAIFLLAKLLVALWEMWWQWKDKKSLVARQATQAVSADPVTAGPPMVSGGVTEANADQALRAVASRHFGGTEQDFTVLESTLGRVYGTMLVSYRNNTERAWVMAGQHAYQARVRRPNGHVEVVYMLQACGNDLKFGEVSGYQPGNDFRFEPETPAPVPAPAPKPVVEAAVAIPAEPQQMSSETVPQGTVSVTIKPAGDNRPNLVEVVGIDPTGASFEVSSNGFKLRYSHLASNNNVAA